MGRFYSRTRAPNHKVTRLQNSRAAMIRNEYTTYECVMWSTCTPEGRL